MWNNPVLNVDSDGRWANPVVNSQGEFQGFDELGAGGETIVYDGEFREGMSQDAIFNNGGQFANDFFTGSNFSMGDVMDFQSRANQSFKDRINTEALVATGGLISDISMGLSFMTGGGGGRAATRSGLVARGMGNQAANTGMTTVGRWMSKAEYEMMANTGRMVEGAGGQTFVATGGSGAFNAATKGSVYVEFQVATNSLLQGGQANWFKVLGPNAGKAMQGALQKQGGELLPQIQNLSPILKIK